MTQTTPNSYADQQTQWYLVRRHFSDPASLASD